MKLKDRIAIITGGASGIGRAVAERFGLEGAVVIIADLPQTDGESVVQFIKKEGGKAEFIPTDMTKKFEVDLLIQTVIKRYKKIDIFHNNAGIAMPVTNIEDVGEKEYQKIMDINVKGAFYGIQAVAPHMKQAGEGVILCTGSTSASRPREGLNIYAASKGALIALAKSVALELAPFGIRVNSLSPVVTETSMVDEEQRSKFVKTIPLGKVAQPTDMANTALFLVSDESSMITGVDLEVDGGRCI
ncbi:SDR family NAD(P)-dependent oxidoreductase [Oceanobacillus timonensis]|uniref:SDR family NAD(P)-dependent oxidoreductase n=1 Tax=Oceanobacillus timonensis TaxID=1926285 RepID=UPI0009B9B2BD|nr:SDR family oxidoreductase [Oceanobacillus timonensis]